MVLMMRTEDGSCALMFEHLNISFSMVHLRDLLLVGSPLRFE